MKLNQIFKFACIAYGALFMTACNDDKKDGDGGKRGPENTEALAGASVSFNPTISFLADGELSYVNEDPESDFVFADVSNPLSGTYQYLPSPSKLEGDLTLSVEGQATETLTLTNFVSQNGNVISFDIVFADGRRFDGIVDGIIKSAPGSGGSTTLEDIPQENFLLTADGLLEGGTSFSRIMVENFGNGRTFGSPLPDYPLGEKVDFVIGDDNSLNFDGFSLQSSGSSGNFLRWRDTDELIFAELVLGVSGEADLAIAYQPFNSPPVPDIQVFDGKRFQR